MVTATTTKRFTVQIGDHLVDLPEADTRDEALRKIGLTPRHWPEKPAIKRQQGKATVKRTNKPHSTTSKHPRSERIIKTARVPNTVTLTPCNAKCDFCGQRFMAIRPTAKYCSVTCRVAYFRKHGGKQ